MDIALNWIVCPFRIEVKALTCDILFWNCSFSKHNFFKPHVFLGTVFEATNFQKNEKNKFYLMKGPLSHLNVLHVMLHCIKCYCYCFIIFVYVLTFRKHRIVETSWIPVAEFQIWRLILLTTQSHLCCAVCFHVLQDNSALDVELVAVALSVSPISGACIKSRFVYWRTKLSFNMDSDMRQHKLLYLLQNCVRFGWNSIIILHYPVQNSWYL